MNANELKQQKQHTGLKLIGVIALAAMLLPALAGAAIVAVPDGDVAGLYDAVANAAPGDTIELAAGGLYTLDAGQLVVDITLTIQGNGATIVGDGASRVFYVADTGALTLNNLTVTGGSAPGPGFPDDSGGGIYNDGGAVTLNDSNVNNNTADAGGGIMNTGTMTLNNSSVNHNTASELGGGILSAFGLVTLNSDSRVNHNTASSGGGIYKEGGTLNENGGSVLHNHPNDIVQ